MVFKAATGYCERKDAIARPNSYFPCKSECIFCNSIILIPHPATSNTILSHRPFNCDLLSLFICPQVFPLLPFHLPFSGIFSLQTNLQPNSHPILILPLLQCSFPQPLARVDRCRERKEGERQSQVDTTAPLVSLNLSKVLCQVFPVRSCIPFTSLKVTQKERGL